MCVRFNYTFSQPLPEEPYGMHTNAHKHTQAKTRNRHIAGKKWSRANNGGLYVIVSSTHMPVVTTSKYKHTHIEISSLHNDISRGRKKNTPWLKLVPIKIADKFIYGWWPFCHCVLLDLWAVCGGAAVGLDSVTAALAPAAWFIHQLISVSKPPIHVHTKTDTHCSAHHPLEWTNTHTHTHDARVRQISFPPPPPLWAVKHRSRHWLSQLWLFAFH